MEQGKVASPQLAVVAVDAQDDQPLPVDRNAAHIDRELGDVVRLDAQLVPLRIKRTGRPTPGRGRTLFLYPNPAIRLGDVLRVRVTSRDPLARLQPDTLTMPPRRVSAQVARPPSSSCASRSWAPCRCPSPARARMFDVP